MLTPGYTHKSYKITSATTASYRQLFVLITMLLTVLSVQQSTFTMAAPLQQQPIIQAEHHLLYDNHPLHPAEMLLLAETNVYDHYHQSHPYHQAEQQLETDSVVATIEERLKKRHITWHDYYENIMQSQQVNWYNPCGGISHMNERAVKRKRPPPIKKELKKLQNTIVKNFKTINETLRAINIKKMSDWRHIKSYSFLPKLNINSTISLRRWHRQIQTYVAAFEYLRRAQLHFDNQKTSLESDFSHELYELMKDARVILCNIEHAINNTTTRMGKSEIDSLFINRTEMEKKFKFKTDLKHISPLHWYKYKDDKTRYLVNELDLKFAKSHYYSYIRKLIKILRIHTKRPGPIYLCKKNRQQSQIPHDNPLSKTRHATKNSNRRCLQRS